jgi:hypothetical protein
MNTGTKTLYESYPLNVNIGKLFDGAIQMIDERKYRDYETYHWNEMPVYSALGCGGVPGKPAELHLIPFQEVKLEMSSIELLKYGNPKFFYDTGSDRLI